jgi:hypoxanthine-guanine phosphoribosyltransferase
MDYIGFEIPPLFVIGYGKTDIFKKKKKWKEE